MMVDGMQKPLVMFDWLQPEQISINYGTVATALKNNTILLQTFKSNLPDM